jgi:hypothetical protein
LKGKDRGMIEILSWYLTGEAEDNYEKPEAG